MTRYATPPGGLPPQSALMTQRAVFTEAYAVLPAGTMRDITHQPAARTGPARGYGSSRGPMTGFAETFSHYVMEVQPGGGSDRPDPDPGAETALFVTEGKIIVLLDGTRHRLEAGGFAYLPPGSRWSLENPGAGTAHFHWLRKRYEAADGLGAPDPIFVSDQEVEPTQMPDTDLWATTRFMDPADLRHDMHVTIVTLQPGGTIPFEETHVMEHGLYVLQGQRVSTG